MWEGVTRLRSEGDRHEIRVVGTRSNLTVTIPGLEARWSAARERRG